MRQLVKFDKLNIRMIDCQPRGAPNNLNTSSLQHWKDHQLGAIGVLKGRQVQDRTVPLREKSRRWQCSISSLHVNVR